MIQHFIFSKDAAKKKIFVERSFNAPLASVWAAWTDASLLDQWWAPKPWKAETKTMDFRPGGLWLYAMVGPDGTKMFSRGDYKTVNQLKNFSYDSSFCDENGTENPDLPKNTWNVKFIATPTGTQVNVELDFEREADFKQIIAWGFEGGFTMRLGNLDELLAQ